MNSLRASTGFLLLVLSLAVIAYFGLMMLLARGQGEAKARGPRAVYVSTEPGCGPECPCGCQETGVCNCGD